LTLYNDLLPYLNVRVHHTQGNHCIVVYCVTVLQIDDYVNFISKDNRQRFVLTTNDLFQKDRTTSGKHRVTIQICKIKPLK